MSDFDLRLYRSTFRVLKRVLLAGALSGLGAASMPAWANATLRVGDTWSGSYRCAGQAGVLTLRFVEVPTDAPDSRSMALVKAELSFEEAARKGSLYVAGKYAAWLRLVALAPAGWIERPEEAVAMGFSGSVTRDGQEFKGRLERANCDAVTLTRGTREEVAAREAANPAPAATASVAGPGGSGVEIFGIRLGGPLSWAKCVGRSPRPCVMFSSSEATRGYHLIFGSEAEPAMLFDGRSIGLGVVDQRVERVSFDIRREDEHLQAFEQKFGAPNKELVPMHNDQGGRWTGFIHRWNVAGTSIQMDCTRFERVCSVEIETPRSRQQRQQDKDRRQRL